MTPETLDELDRRVFDLAVQPMPIAELAVRLGVPVAQAHERLDRLYSRLGVSNRAELRELAANPRGVVEAPEPTPDDEYVIGAEDAATEPRAIARRKFLGTAAAVGVIAMSGAGALLFGRRRNGQDEDRSLSFGEVIDLADPTNELRVASRFPLTPIAGEGATFVSQSWPQGERIEWSHGVFFMRTTDGIVNGFQFNPVGGSQVEWSEYKSYADGELFTAINGNNTNTAMLVHRSNLGRAWSWDSREYRLLEAVSSDPLFLLFESVNVRRTFHFVALDDSGAREFASFSSESPPGVEPRVVKQPDGQRVAIFHGSLETPEIAVFDISTGKEWARASINPQAQEKEVFVALPFQRLRSGFLARWLTPTNGRGDIPPRYFSWSFDWNGNQIAFKREDQADTHVAPDGVTRAVQSDPSRDTVRPPNAAPPPSWPSVELHTTEDALPPHELAMSFRLRSAALVSGDSLPPNRWLADGNGFVAAVRGGNARDVRQAIVSTAAEPIVNLPSPPQPQFRQWFDESWMQGAVPHPTNRGLISLGRLHLYNWVSNQMLSALVSNGPDHLDPWSAGANEMVFALPHRGHDFSAPPVLLAPKFEQPPFDDAFEFVVEVDPTGLNLRAAPAVSSASLRVLQDGDRLTLAEPPELMLAESSVWDDETARWFYVRAEDGLEGWVNSAWLAWE